MSIERRIFRGEFRDVPGSNGRQKWATAVRYNVVDDYGTLWLPGVFDEALTERMPTVLYGHDWSNLEHVLGSGIDTRQTPTDVGPPGVDVLMEFADVPAADLAMKLLAPSATSRGAVLRDVSVGFERRTWLRRDKLTPEQLAMGAEEAMQSAGMDELSLVVRGAVPGAQVRGKRTGIALDDVVEIAKRKAAGELTDAEAQAAIDLLAGGDDGDGAPAPSGDGGDPPPSPPDLTADIDAALESIGRSAPRREARFADLMADDVRRMLDIALRDRLMPTPGEQWVWIRDFSDTVVVFDTEGTGWSGTYSLGYSLSGGMVVLSSESPRRVVPKTTYTET